MNYFTQCLPALFTLPHRYAHILDPGYLNGHLYCRSPPTYSLYASAAGIIDSCSRMESITKFRYPPNHNFIPTGLDIALSVFTYWIITDLSLSCFEEVRPELLHH